MTKAGDVQLRFSPLALSERPVKHLRTLMAVVCLALMVAEPATSQDRGDRGRPSMERGYGAPRGRPAMEREYGGPRGGPPEGRGGWRGGEPGEMRGGPSYGRPSEPRVYEPYPAPYSRGVPAFGGGWREQQDFLRQGVRHGQLAPLGRVIGQIGQVTPGRQLDSHLEYLGPRLVYRVRWMTSQGRRVDYFVDAATGAIISER